MRGRFQDFKQVFEILEANSQLITSCKSIFCFFVSLHGKRKYQISKCIIA